MEDLSSKIKETVDSTLSTEMDRREFLLRSGAVALTVVGVSSMLKAFNLREHLPSSSKVATNTQTNSGYGSTPYGR